MLTCVNCKKEMTSEQTKMFAEVLVCDDCLIVAERVYERGHKELRMMLVVLKEMIRASLIKGELQFTQPQGAPAASEDLMHKLSRLAAEVRSAHAVKERDGLRVR